MTKNLNDSVNLFVMPDDLQMNAYYYGFIETGVREIDEILSAVAMAGKAYHHTSDWNDPDFIGNDSACDLIQEMANRAAEKLGKNH